MESAGTPGSIFAASAAVRALAAAALPSGGHLAAAGDRTLAAAEDLATRYAPVAARAVAVLVGALDWLAVPYAGARFHRLDPERQERLIRRWQGGALMRWPLFAATFFFKAVHFDDPDFYERMGCVHDKGGPAGPVPWRGQVLAPEELEPESELECEVVVVGTGAGGAVVGKELAEKGYAVAFVEEGAFHQRDSFRGHAWEAHHRFYRRGGMVTVGNLLMPVLAGRLVGGSTAINTGTCFRTPDFVLDGWCEERGSDELSPARMAPHLDRVLSELGAVPGPLDALGGVARVAARGCDELGWNHFPILRNAPDCDGQGTCDFGCPSGARRSVDVSYLPQALRRGAVVHTGMKVRRVLVEGGRAVGVEAREVRGTRTLRVRAGAVVLAGGAIPTPVLLQGQGLCGGSGQLGRNLSLHPSVILSGLFDERLEGYNAIPQGYGCDAFQREGFLLLGASAPLDFGATLLPFAGRRLVETLEAWDRVGSFMVMIRDESRGSVRRLDDRRFRIRYSQTDRDADLVHRGLVRIGQMFVAGGARALFPPILGRSVLDGPDPVAQLRGVRVRPWNTLATSFHPLGTCRMGPDPATSVVGMDHQAHELPGLFVVDGSTVPGPPGVNPQVTIMALATRAADRIAERLG